MKKTLLLLCLGLIVGYALSYLPTKKIPSQITKQATDESKTLLTNYFPIKKGSFWEYKGTKKEQVDGKIETSDIQKRVEVNDITTDSEVNTLTVTNEGQAEKWLIEKNIIDFEPNDLQDKFILTFPLYIGQKWGDEEQLRNRTDGYYVWEVEQKLSQEVLGKKYDECFRIALKMVTGTEYKIFCYGIGIVEEGYKHNGTVTEETYELTAYQDTKEYTGNKTQVIKYEQASISKESESGSCWTTSIATPSNEKAWRCSSGNYIYDPCFDVGNNKVVCEPDPEDPTSGLTLNLTEELPSDNERPKPEETHSWLYKLENDIYCYAHTGTADILEDILYYYGCDNGALMRGDEDNAINKNDKSWSTTIVYRDKNSKVTKKETLSILKVWR